MEFVRISIKESKMVDVATETFRAGAASRSTT